MLTHGYIRDGELTVAIGAVVEAIEADVRPADTTETIGHAANDVTGLTLQGDQRQRSIGLGCDGDITTIQRGHIIGGVILNAPCIGTYWEREAPGTVNIGGGGLASILNGHCHTTVVTAILQSYHAPQGAIGPAEVDVIGQGVAHLLGNGDRMGRAEIARPAHLQGVVAGFKASNGEGPTLLTIYRALALCNIDFCTRKSAGAIHHLPGKLVLAEDNQTGACFTA